MSCTPHNVKIKKMPAKPARFPHWLWLWTGAGENLFTLTPTELAMFEQFVQLATAWEPRS